MSVWVVVAYALAVARVTRLITTDQITDPPRRALLSRLSEQRRADRAITYLATCDWCVSIWVAAPAAVLVTSRYVTSRWILAVVLALAFSQTAGLLGGAGRT